MSDVDTEGMLQAIAILQPRSEGAGRVIMIVSARRGEGVTKVAQALALAAGPNPVFALDLDLRRNRLAQALSERGLGEAAPSDFSGERFCTILDREGEIVCGESLAYRRVGNTQLRVGVLNARAIPAGGKLRLSAGAGYWDAVRAAGATMIVDAPAIEQGRTSLAVARHVDAVILVVGGGEGAAPAALAAKRALDRVGSPVLGIVYTGAPAPLARLFGR